MKFKKMPKLSDLDYNGQPSRPKDGLTPKVCTLITDSYLPRGLALYYSLQRHTPRFWLWILCVDDAAYRLLKKINLANVIPVKLDLIMNERLREIKQQRQGHEFCWTIKASFITYLFTSCEPESLLYLDADLFFFKSLAAIYEEWGEHSVFLTKHWYGPRWEKRSGKYNAGLIGFKRDETGMECLRSWRRNCLKWCYDRHEPGRWGDQVYLDAWPRLLPNIRISANKGINAGPWNIKRNYQLYAVNDDIYFAGRELACYHFSGFEIINENEYVLCNRKKLPPGAEMIYAPYVNEIQRVMAKIKSADPNFLSFISR